MAGVSSMTDFSYSNNIGLIPVQLPGCVVWLDAADTYTITSSGGTVSAWKDKSGRGNSPTQATGANQPATGTRTISSLNVLDFNGSSTFMTMPSNDIFDNPFSLFIVSQSDTIASQKTMIGRQQGSESGGFNIRVAGNSTNFTAFAVGNGSTFSTVDLTGVSTNTVIHSVTFNGAVSYQINNGSITTAGSVTYDNASVRAATIGNVASGAYWDGAIAEIVIYNRVVTSTEQVFLNRYFARKWGVTIS